jgi:O-antigen/teichoic acid export membrane protein
LYFGPEALGIFFVGAIEIPFVSVLLTSVFNVISPVLNKFHHEGDTQNFAIFIGKTLKFTAKLIWPFFIYLMFFADHLIPLVFKSEYAPSVSPFRVYLIMMPVRIALYGVIIIALGKTQIVFLASLGAMLINLVLNVLFVQWIGFIGPAIATVISTYLHVALLVMFILKFLKVRFADLVPVRAFFDIGSACVIAVMAAYLMTSMMTNDLTVVILSLSIFVGVYIFLGSKAGFIQIMNFTEFAKGSSRGKKNDRPED